MTADREFLQSALDALDVHLAVVDVQGTIVLVNGAWHAFARENDLEPEQVGPGVSYLAACERAQGSEREQGLAAAAGIRQVLAGEQRFFQLPYSCHSPSQKRWYVLRVSRFQHAGQVYALTAHEDITEPRFSEEETLQAKAEAEAASQAKDQFLAMLGHELRTPLTPVLLRVSSLLQAPYILPEVRETLAMIKRHVELEARLIEDVLDMSRITRDKLELVFEVTNVHEALQAALEIFAKEIEDKQLQVELKPTARRSHVQADRARLRQVFWNLISNAVKFTPPQGRITLRSFNKPGGWIAVHVSDSGIGLEPELLPRLFSPFEQGNSIRMRRTEGLGLGLSISQMLVEKMGGSLIAWSAGRDQGSIFTVSLPSVTAPRGQREKQPHQEPVAAELERPLRVLLVEDNDEIQELMAYQIQIIGHEVKTAASVEQALAIASTEEIDLMIADIALPDGTGWDLMQALRARRPIRAIALSGYAAKEDIARSKAAGFIDHLSKPISFEQLERYVGRAPSAPQEGGEV